MGTSRRGAEPVEQQGGGVCYLDDGDSGFESGRQLVQNFSQELLVLEDLPHLHDSHYRSLRTHISVNSLVL